MSSTKEKTPQIYVTLFHGRTTKNQELDDWGIDGPTFACDWLSDTYDCNLRMQNGDDTQPIFRIGEFYCYDGIYYGDWTVSATLHQDMNLTVYDKKKASMPEN